MITFRLCFVFLVVSCISDRGCYGVNFCSYDLLKLVPSCYGVRLGLKFETCAVAHSNTADFSLLHSINDHKEI